MSTSDSPLYPDPDPSPKPNTTPQAPASPPPDTSLSDVIPPVNPDLESPPPDFVPANLDAPHPNIPVSGLGFSGGALPAPTTGPDGPFEDQNGQIFYLDTWLRTSPITLPPPRVKEIGRAHV